MPEHEAKLIYDDSMLARKWGVWCETCQKTIAACTSENDARDCLANHLDWMALRDQFSEKAPQITSTGPAKA